MNSLFCTKLKIPHFSLAGERGSVHLRLHHPVLDPAAAGVRGLRRRQADEQPKTQDEADQGGAQQQQRARTQEAGKKSLLVNILEMT